MMIALAACGQSKMPQGDTGDSTTAGSDNVSFSGKNEQESIISSGNEQESITTSGKVTESEKPSANTQGPSSRATTSQTSSKATEQTSPNTTVTELRLGTILYSHGCIEKAWKYPGWETISVDNETGEQKIMNKIDDRAYIDDGKDQKAFFDSDSQAFPSATHDMLYVYTVPCDVTVKIEMIARVYSSSSDGIVTYCYLNDKSNYLIDKRVIVAADEVLDQTTYKKTGSELVKLKKGDILYCGYGANQTTDYDEGNFYVKMTFLSVAK